MGTKGKLFIIALLMSGIVALLVWSKNGDRKKGAPVTGVTNKGAVEGPGGTPDDSLTHPDTDSGDRLHVPSGDGGMPPDGGYRVETANGDGRTPVAVDTSVHSEPVRPADPPVAKKTYTVVAGDSLARIAMKMYGKESAWRQIYEANKDKMTSPDDLLRVGTALAIPGAPEAVKGPGNETVTPPVKNDPPKNETVKTDPPGNEAKKTYKVKPGDTLSSIAKATLGDPNKWKAIYLANKDKMANPDSLTEGMELSIP